MSRSFTLILKQALAWTNNPTDIMFAICFSLLLPFFRPIKCLIAPRWSKTQLYGFIFFFTFITLHLKMHLRFILRCWHMGLSLSHKFWWLGPCCWIYFRGAKGHLVEFSSLCCETELFLANEFWTFVCVAVDSLGWWIVCSLWEEFESHGTEN